MTERDRQILEQILEQLQEAHKQLQDARLKETP